MPDISLPCEPKCSCAPGYAREHAEGGICIEQTQCPEPAPECPKVNTPGVTIDKINNCKLVFDIIKLIMHF